MSRIHVGTSGWSYPSGKGTWNGVFYPARRPRGFDELAYYAQHFDTVEVNSTFYRMPEAAMAASWRRRTPAGFLFAVKLFQKFTHPDMYLTKTGAKAWDLTRTDVDLFRAGIGPLAEAERLAAVLIQFPPSFHQGDETREYLAWLLEAFAGYPLAVELRHRSWSDAAAETHALLDAAGAAWTLIDEPKFESSIRQSFEAPSRSALTYLRLHGRNAAAWWEHDAAEDRYDYLYSPKELQAFTEPVRKVARTGRRVLVYFNNHFSAKAVANAAVLKHDLGQILPGDYPQTMLASIPSSRACQTAAFERPARFLQRAASDRAQRRDRFRNASRRAATGRQRYSPLRRRSAGARPRRLRCPTAVDDDIPMRPKGIACTRLPNNYSTRRTLLEGVIKTADRASARPPDADGDGDEDGERRLPPIDVGGVADAEIDEPGANSIEGASAARRWGHDPDHGRNVIAPEAVLLLALQVRVLDRVGHLDAIDDGDARRHLADDGVLAVEARTGGFHDVELAVGRHGVAGVAEADRPPRVLPLHRDLECVDRLAAAARAPVLAVRHVPRSRIAPLHERPFDAMEPLAAIEAAANQPDEVLDALRRLQKKRFRWCPDGFEHEDRRRRSRRRRRTRRRRHGGRHHGSKKDQDGQNGAAAHDGLRMDEADHSAGLRYSVSHPRYRC
jgi:uncharacterized protein YecE (DUF72 family)